MLNNTYRSVIRLVSEDKYRMRNLRCGTAQNLHVHHHDVSQCAQCKPHVSQSMCIAPTQDDLHGDQGAQGHGVQSQVTPPDVVIPEVTTHSLQTSDSQDKLEHSAFYFCDSKLLVNGDSVVC